MSIDLPPPLAEYLDAKRAHDSDALLATLTSDAVITDEGTTYTGNTAIHEWNERASKAVQATYAAKAVQRIGNDIVVTVEVAGNFPTSPVTLFFHATLRDDKIAAMAITDQAPDPGRIIAVPISLPAPVANFLAADNAKDPDLLARCFTNNAFVHDEGKDYRGVDAIKAWSQDSFAKYEHIIEPLDATVASDTVNLHARLTGSFPNSPVELDFRFTFANDKIARLEIN
jgi:hypothetical protein